MILEACVETIAEALAAQQNGADRIELCSNLLEGGITPSFGLISTVKSQLDIPVMVMIRPRGGNFVYGKFELEIMKQDIDLCKELKVDGVVLGLLRPDEKSIDLDKTAMLCEHAIPLEVTFHKAIDNTSDPLIEFLKLKDAQIVNRVLTSGGAASAIEGSITLNKMIQESGEELSVIVAGKVTHQNLKYIIKIIPANEYHGRKIVV